MIELTRFQMLRPAQKISEEEKSQVGLALYGGQPQSTLVRQLIAADTPEEYTSLAERFAARDNGKVLVTRTPPDVDLLALYQWLGYKARPIRLKDLENFLRAWVPKGSLDLAAEWTRIADNFVLSIVDA